jgi:hypothetical protein
MLHPDQPLALALRRVGDHAFLPVVHRADPTRLVGVIGIDDVIRSFRKGRGETAK